MGVSLLTACSPKAAPTPSPAAAPRAQATVVPSPGQANKTPQGLPQPTSSAPSGSVGSALEWYPLVDKAAKEWQSDAVVNAVIGGNIAAGGGSLPCDGKAERWNHTFVSVAAQKKLQIAVQGGVLGPQTESALTTPDGKALSEKDLEPYKDTYTASDWKVDSTQAATAANALFTAKYTVEPKTISYVLFNNKTVDMTGKTVNWMRWIVSYDPEKYPFQVTLDARTGEVKAQP
jgi:hypothetical protein